MAINSVPVPAKDDMTTVCANRLLAAILANVLHEGFTRGGPLLPRLVGAAVNLSITACFVFLLRRATKADSAR